MATPTNPKLDLDQLWNESAPTATGAPSLTQLADEVFNSSAEDVRKAHDAFQRDRANPEAQEQYRKTKEAYYRNNTPGSRFANLFPQNLDQANDALERTANALEDTIGHVGGQAFLAAKGLVTQPADVPAALGKGGLLGTFVSLPQFGANIMGAAAEQGAALANRPDVAAALGAERAKVMGNVDEFKRDVSQNEIIQYNPEMAPLSWKTGAVRNRTGKLPANKPITPEVKAGAEVGDIAGVMGVQPVSRFLAGGEKAQEAISTARSALTADEAANAAAEALGVRQPKPGILRQAVSKGTEFALDQTLGRMGKTGETILNAGRGALKSLADNASKYGFKTPQEAAAAQAEAISNLNDLRAKLAAVAPDSPEYHELYRQAMGWKSKYDNASLAVNAVEEGLQTAEVGKAGRTLLQQPLKNAALGAAYGALTGQPGESVADSAAAMAVYGELAKYAPMAEAMGVKVADWAKAQLKANEVIAGATPTTVTPRLLKDAAEVEQAVASAPAAKADPAKGTVSVAPLAGQDAPMNIPSGRDIINLATKSVPVKDTSPETPETPEAPVKQAPVTQNPATVNDELPDNLPAKAPKEESISSAPVSGEGELVSGFPMPGTGPAPKKRTRYSFGNPTEARTIPMEPGMMPGPEKRVLETLADKSSAVASSRIARAAYDPEGNFMYVMFNEGRQGPVVRDESGVTQIRFNQYLLGNVTPEEYQSFLDAESKGSFFTKNFRYQKPTALIQHTFEDLTGRQPEPPLGKPTWKDKKKGEQPPEAGPAAPAVIVPPPPKGSPQGKKPLASVMEPLVPVKASPEAVTPVEPPAAQPKPQKGKALAAVPTPEPAKPLETVAETPTNKPIQSSPEPVASPEVTTAENPRSTAIAKVLEAVDDATMNLEPKSKIITLAKKAVRDGHITETQFAELKRISADRDMGIEDVGGEFSSMLRNASETASAPAENTIAPSPAQDVRVSKLAGKKQLAAQKEFILDAVEQLKANAPETVSAETGAKVKIEVPDDGTFTIENSQKALTSFGNAVKRGFGKNLGPLGPKPAPTEPRTIAKVNANPSAKDLQAVVESTVSTERGRDKIAAPSQQGIYTLSTNGKQLTIVTGAKAETRPDFPDIKPILPAGLKLGKTGVVLTGRSDNFTVNTGDLLKQVNQAILAANDKNSMIKLHADKAGNVIVTAEDPGFGEYSSAPLPKNAQKLFAVDGNYLKDALQSARKLGYDSATLVVDEATRPIAVYGGENFAQIIQPLDEKPLGKAPGKPLAPEGAVASEMAKVRGANIGRLIRMQGEKLYSGDIGRTTGKELVQNAIDNSKKAGSTVLAGDWNIGRDGNPDWFGIIDRGTGMTPDDLLTKFLPAGESGKDIGEGGGLGLAKVAILGSNKKWEVSTIAKQDDGSYVHSYLTGSGPSYLNFVNIDQDVDLKPDTDIVLYDGLTLKYHVYAPGEVEGDIATGTAIRVETANPSNASSFVNKAMRFVPEMELRGITGSKSNDPGLRAEDFLNMQMTETDMVPGRPDSWQLLHTVDLPEATIDFIAPVRNGAVSNNRSRYHYYNVLNRSILQFDKSVNFDEEVLLPEGLAVNIKSKVKAEESSYPFTTNREAFNNEKIESEIKRYFGEAGMRAAKAINDRYASAVGNAPALKNFPKLRFLDVSNNVPAELVERVRSDPALYDVYGDVKYLQEQVLKALQEKYPNEEKFFRATLGGIMTGGNAYGVHFGKSNSTEASVIYHDPFLTFGRAKATAQEMLDAGKLTEEELIPATYHLWLGETAGVALHEAGHQKINSEGEELARFLTFENSLPAKALQRLQGRKDIDYKEIYDKMSDYETELAKHRKGKEADDFIVSQGGYQGYRFGEKAADRPQNSGDRGKPAPGKGALRSFSE